MTGCSAPGCKSRSESGTKLFKVPANSIRREVWSACCGRQLMNSWRLCEVNIMIFLFSSTLYHMIKVYL